MHERCRVVGPPSGMWNGIAATSDGQTVFVCDVLERKITSFNKTATGELILYVILLVCVLLFVILFLFPQLAFAL
jgi:hypothetical protein